MTMHRGKNMNSRMKSGAKPTTYIHESQMNAENNAPGQKLYSKKDLRGKTNNVHTRVPNENREQCTGAKTLLQE
jgi:hypothetical protein